ncbi:MAG: hypothetical protein JW809_00235 [Pirellulales bacterium]|nr:hypothetical protein [Pirellulales bacterium]
MPISILCPHCGRTLQARDEWAGKQVRCACGEAITVADDGGVMSLLKEELNINTNPIVCVTPDEWVKATGASDEVAEQLQRKLKPKASGNANVMMAVTGAIAALMLVIGLAVFFFVR